MMTQSDVISRPELTLPNAEARHLRAAYERAKSILEYGSGGSTVMAAEMPSKHVYSVESDHDWTMMMRAWFAQNPPAMCTKVDVIWSDIGPTKEWGYPQDQSGWRRYARYPLGIWNEDGFLQPDIVFVDGRFRAGCALAVALRTSRPVTVLIDDYRQRRQYHRVEEYIGRPRRMIGRMAEFEVSPMPLPADRLLSIIEMMIHP